jgi:hypothetical protein
MVRTGDLTATVHRLQRELQVEQQKRRALEQRLGGVQSVNAKLRALVLAYRAKEAVTKAKQAAKGEARAPS